MGYIVATLLQYNNEEDSFWFLIMLLNSPYYGNLRGLFIEGMPKLNSYFSILNELINQDMKNLYIYFETLHIHLSMFSSTWFMTLFTGSFTNFETVSRIIDIMCVQGKWWIIKVALALLKLSEKFLLGNHNQPNNTNNSNLSSPPSSNPNPMNHSLEYCIFQLKYLQNHIQSDILIEQALNIKLDYQLCENLELAAEKEQLQYANHRPTTKTSLSSSHPSSTDNETNEHLLFSHSTKHEIAEEDEEDGIKAYGPGHRIISDEEEEETEDGHGTNNSQIELK